MSRNLQARLRKTALSILESHNSVSGDMYDLGTRVSLQMENFDTAGMYLYESPFYEDNLTVDELNQLVNGIDESV